MFGFSRISLWPFSLSSSHSFCSHLHEGSDLSPDQHVELLGGYCCGTSNLAHHFGIPVYFSWNIKESSLISVTSSISILQDLTSPLSKAVLPPSLCCCLTSGSHPLPGLLLSPHCSLSFALLSEPPSSFYESPLKKKKRFYLFIHEKHTQRGRDIDRGRSRLLAESPMWDLIPGPGSHPELKVDAQLLSHPGIPQKSDF